ncbi:secreted RxLR effector protein 161-like [Telopea speciosissima]|uniref:secreted RxLR effector protein 161-like n=1 Tax=Telopea speciosissima TaxID=54955 RepID=UPI001CC5FC49|nr:secreted RxLR effector protein 161-like [Telopea speciosissima]
MSQCSGSDAPISKGEKLNKGQCPRNDVERNSMKDKPYASAVGSLMYAQVCTRPDIAFAVGVLGRFQSNVGLAHWTAAKKVMHCLQRTKDFKLVFNRSENLEVVGYSDSDYSGCTDDMKFTSGYIFLMGGGPISWKSVKQTIIASSTMQAEFVALFEATKQVVWLRNFISELKVVDSISRPLRVWCDNTSAVCFSKNNKKTSSSKHIEIKYLLVKEKVCSKEVEVEHISMEKMVVDPLTKDLAVGVFKRHVSSMGIVDSFDVFG